MRLDSGYLLLVVPALILSLIAQLAVKSAYKKYGKIANDIDTCILCGLCAKKCPLGLITVDRKDTKTWSIDRDSCLQCGMCVEACAKFHCLGYADDDAEYGIVTYKKEA